MVEHARMESIDTPASVKRISQEFIVLWRLTNATQIRVITVEFAGLETTHTPVHVPQVLWELAVKSTSTNARQIPAGKEQPALIMSTGTFAGAVVRCGPYVVNDATSHKVPFD